MVAYLLWTQCSSVQWHSAKTICKYWEEGETNHRRIYVQSFVVFIKFMKMQIIAMVTHAHLRGRRRRVCRVWSYRVSRPPRRKSRCLCSTSERCDCGSSVRWQCSTRSHGYATLHRTQLLASTVSLRRYSSNWNHREFTPRKHVPLRFRSKFHLQRI